MPTSPPSEARRRRVVRGLLSLVVVTAVFVGILPRVADLSEVWGAIRAMTLLEVLTVLAVAGWNLATYWLVQISSLPGLSTTRAAVATQASTALANTLPAGAAVGIGVMYSMYASWGFSRSAVTLSLLLSGIWNNFAKIGMPVVALALLALQGNASPGLVAAALIGVGMLAGALTTFGLVLRSDRLARRVGTFLSAAVSRVRRPFGREPVTGWAEAAERFRAETIGVLRARWAALTLATLVSHVSLYLVLLVSLRHVGVPDTAVTWAEVLGAFAFVRLVSALPLTPGGLGVVELGLTAALAVAGGDHELVVAGVLVYRALTYLPPIPTGAVAYLLWRRDRIMATG